MHAKACRLGIVALIATAIVGGPAHAAGLVIADRGKSDYVIVTPASPTQAEDLAAREISRYIEKISRVRLPIRRGGDLPKRALVVGHRGWTVPAKVDRLMGDQFAVLTRGERIHLVGGRDRATLYAAYRLLEWLGCRWLAPELDHYQGAAEFVPRRARLVLKPGDQTVTPSIHFRTIHVEEGESHDERNLVTIIDWMSKVGFNVLSIPMDFKGDGRVVWDRWREKLTPVLRERDILIAVGGHGYENFLNRTMEGGELARRHPEWFGKHDRITKPAERDSVFTFCTSNEKAASFVIAGVVEFLRKRPEIDIFDFRPPDAARWCECDRCAALGSPPERQARLHASLNKALAREGLPTRTSMLSYEEALAPPKSEKIDKSILVDVCPSTQDFQFTINDPKSQENAKYVDALRAWRQAFEGDLGVYSYYRKYVWGSLPVLLPHYMQADLKFYMTIPIQGFSTYAEPADWFTYELNHYVLARLLMDTGTDVDATIADFAAARYGAQAPAAIQGFSALENDVRKFGSLRDTSLKSAVDIREASGRLRKAAGKIARAREKTSHSRVRYSLERLLLMFDYAERDLAIQEMRAQGKSGSEMAPAFQELYSFVQAHFDKGLFSKGRRLNASIFRKRFRPKQ